MKYTVLVCTILLSVATLGLAQVSSHAPTSVAASANAGSAAPAGAAATSPASLAPSMPSAQVTTMAVTDKPVAKVNGAVLTDRDLLREMYTIFPYAKQHNGFPKGQEAAIRQGALEMIIFEELVYQEAVRRKLTIPTATLTQAEGEFKKQFHSPDEYQAYLQAEMSGSEKNVREKIRRSMLIEKVLETDVEAKAAVTNAEVQAYYEKNGARFERAESYTFQSISVVPALKPTPEQAKQALAKAQDALKKAKETKSYQDFGLLAESMSEDDFRVNMGDHKEAAKDKLPPQIVKAFQTMQAGQVSGLIQIESAYTIVRLNAHNPARRQPFAEVKGDLKTELQKTKYEKLRSGLAKQLRAKAKVEVG